MVAADFACQPCIVQTVLDGCGAVFHPVGVFNQLSVEIRPCRVCVLWYDGTLDVGGSSAVVTCRLFHVIYYKSHDKILSSLLVIDDDNYIYTALRRCSRGVQRGGVPLPYWGIFSGTEYCGSENSLISYGISFH